MVRDALIARNLQIPVKTTHAAGGSNKDRVVFIYIKSDDDIKRRKEWLVNAVTRAKYECNVYVINSPGILTLTQLIG